MIQKHTKKFLIISSTYILFQTAVFAQLPGWRTVHDSDGNRYYIDRSGRIHTDGANEFPSGPVSAEGIDFYLARGLQLLQEHRPAEGLTILKTIMALPQKDDRIFQAQARTAREIDRLKKKEGGRYAKLDRLSSLLVFREGEELSLINVSAGYSIKFPCRATIIRHTMKERPHYFHSGILTGLNLDISPSNKEKTTTYDALIALDTERFKSTLKNAGQLKSHWDNTSGGDSFERKAILSKEDSLMFEYRSPLSGEYWGYEKYCIRGKSGFFLRFITARNLTEIQRVKVMKILESLKY